jgi:hypothetical protein
MVLDWAHVDICVSIVAEGLSTVPSNVQLVNDMPVIRINKTVGMDRDVFTYIADLNEETDTPFNDVLNNLCRDGIAARENQEDK